MDLAIIVLEQIAEGAVEHARNPSLERRGVFPGIEAPSCGFYSHQLHRGVRHEGVEDSHRIRSPADTGDDRIGQTTELREELRAGLVDRAAERAQTMLRCCRLTAPRSKSSGARRPARLISST